MQGQFRDQGSDLLFSNAISVISLMRSGDRAFFLSMKWLFWKCHVTIVWIGYFFLFDLGFTWLLIMLLEEWGLMFSSRLIIQNGGHSAQICRSRITIVIFFCPISLFMHLVVCPKGFSGAYSSVLIFFA